MSRFSCLTSCENEQKRFGGVIEEKSVRVRKDCIHTTSLKAFGASSGLSSSFAEVMKLFGFNSAPGGPAGVAWAGNFAPGL